MISRMTEGDTDLDWAEVRRAFSLDPSYAHFASYLISSHPRPVADAIERHRSGFDKNPAVYFEENVDDCEERVFDAAHAYLGAQRDSVAIVGSTTMGLGLVYAGINLRDDDEILTSEHE